VAPAHDLALSGFPYDAALGPLGDLQALILGELIEDTVCKFSFWALIAPVIEGAHLGAVLPELAPEEEVVRGLSCEAVPVLCQHH
jgi:hypothetical protein